MTDTSTPEGREKRKAQLVDAAMKKGSGTTLVRLIGGSIEDFDERWDPSMSGGHPDERHQ
jgi:hypothetical protein